MDGWADKTALCRAGYSESGNKVYIPHENSYVVWWEIERKRPLRAVHSAGEPGCGKAGGWNRGSADGDD